MAALNKATQFQNLNNLDMSTKDSKTKQPCTLHSVIGSITVSKGNRPTNKHITSNHIFFSEPITYYVSDGCIYLRHCFIDDNKNIVKPVMDKKTGYYHFYICIEEIELKKYEFEEDSTEDEVIIYYL